MAMPYKDETGEEIKSINKCAYELLKEERHDYYW